MPHDYEKELLAEIEKWTYKIKSEMKGISPKIKERAEFIQNIEAYIKDSGYFYGKMDLVRSFEAIIWAWSLLEIGLDEGILLKDDGGVNQKDENEKNADKKPRHKEKP